MLECFFFEILYWQNLLNNSSVCFIMYRGLTSFQFCLVPTFQPLLNTPPPPPKSKVILWHYSLWLLLDSFHNSIFSDRGWQFNSAFANKKLNLIFKKKSVLFTILQLKHEPLIYLSGIVWTYKYFSFLGSNINEKHFCTLPQPVL